MTIDGWVQIALFSVTVILITRPLGGYMTRVFAGERRYNLDDGLRGNAVFRLPSPVLRPLGRAVANVSVLRDRSLLRVFPLGPGLDWQEQPARNFLNEGVDGLDGRGCPAHAYR